jgi:hypothetical protein
VENGVSVKVKGAVGKPIDIYEPFRILRNEILKFALHSRWNAPDSVNAWNDAFDDTGSIAPRAGHIDECIHNGLQPTFAVPVVSDEFGTGPHIETSVVAPDPRRRQIAHYFGMPRGPVLLGFVVVEGMG